MVQYYQKKRYATKFDLDVDISTIYWLDENLSNRMSIKKIIDQLYELHVL